MYFCSLKEEQEIESGGYHQHSQSRISYPIQDTCMCGYSFAHGISIRTAFLAALGFDRLWGFGQLFHQLSMAFLGNGVPE
jgi:hypothetical protein